MFDGVQHFKPM